MKKYNDYEDIKQVEWTKYVIIVPTENDRKEIMEAFKHFHDSNIDTENIVVNQLAHEYLTEEDLAPGSKNNIIVDSVMFQKLKTNF